MPDNRPPDWQARSRALDPTQSFLVQAAAGSGKTYLLTQRFLRLLAQAERPDEIVAITFTIAAAAEMRNRVLEALEAAAIPEANDPDPESLEALAAAALHHARQMDWQLLDLPSQLRITTIDAFCRGLALQSPLSWGLLSGLGGALNLTNSKEAYRTAARRTLAVLEGESTPGTRAAREPVEALLLWRDNNWQEIENLIVQMLENRNRWMRDIVFARGQDAEEDIWPALRRRLEAPFHRAARRKLEVLNRLMDHLPESRDYALQLARQACSQGGKQTPVGLAERAELPVSLPEPGSDDESLELEEAVAAYRDLACFLLTSSGTWRKKGGLTAHQGFPAGAQGKPAKEQFAEFLESLAQEPGLESALATLKEKTPVRYQEQEWQLIRHCFAVLRTAAAQLQLVFAETGTVDFTEVAQIALRVLAPEDGFPSDFALRQADSIRHLLVDEFQDTSRQQHQLLSRLIAAWPEREGRTCFCVGDPMQSIYGFRDAEVELFERLKTHGLEPDPGLYEEQFSEAFPFEFLQLQANFRTVPSLIADLNNRFSPIFNPNPELPPDPNAVQFSPAIAARESNSRATTELHLAFTHSGKPDPSAPASATPEAASATQLKTLVSLIQQKLAAAQLRGEPKYRMAVLGRTRKSLIPIAEALRERQIPFRALDLVKLNERPEVLDALTLARALLNPADRTAWLGILRAPWCGLSLADLHLITSADDPAIASKSIPVLLETRLPQLQSRLAPETFTAATRVAQTMRHAIANRASTNSSLGTWLQSVWISLGGQDTVDRAQSENLSALWTALDKLPDGELDLLGPALTSALDQLYALPDPAASSEFGVQLMTIHKSKGLEFEVVLIPDLEAKSQQTDHALMSWLERGLPPAEDAPGQPGEITEFLIAPIKTKGGNASEAKEWVDTVKKHRDLLELRRLFYVAATRAREELHLFARPRFTIKNGEATLAAPTGLLDTAWPAFAEEIEQQFSTWRTGAQAPAESLAMAAAADNLLVMPAEPKPKPAFIRRLPADYIPPQQALFQITGSAAATADQPYTRSEGGPESRLLGTAIHTLLERFTQLRLQQSHAQAKESLPAALPAITALIRAGGFSPQSARLLASEALATALQAAADPNGAWITAPYPQAETETQWTAWLDPTAKSPRNLRPDRVFFAPPPQEPQNPPQWWIVDYKSGRSPKASGAAELEAFLSESRLRYAPQLEAYAQVLRRLHQNLALSIRAGIFYPRLAVFDHWEC